MKGIMELRVIRPRACKYINSFLGGFPVFAPHHIMTDDWVSADEDPAQVPQQRGIWTASQKTVIRSFAGQWNAEAADRKAILPNIVTALLALPEPPTLQNMGLVRSVKALIVMIH